MKIKKIILVVPPAYTLDSARDIWPLPPMGLGYLAAVARSIGLEVKILDCLIRGWDHEEKVDDKIVRVGLSDSDIQQHIEEFKPDLVGINCQFSRQYKIYHKLLSLIKRVNPKCITLCGGPHVAVCPEEVLADPACDYILQGEAEESFREFISKLNNDIDVTTVDGLGYKSSGKIIVNEKTKWVMNLDSIQFPAYDIMEIERYYAVKIAHGERHKDKFSPIITSRGCPAKCTFCSANRVWGKRFRVRSVENVIAEMRLLKDKYGIEEIIFEDDNVTANPKRAKELFLRMIQEEFNFVWDTPNGVGVWSMDEEMIDLMKQSGCIKLNFPVESGSQTILDTVIKKPLKLEKVRRLVDYCKKIKLDYGMFFVVGMPGEKIRDIWQSFRFAVDCGVNNPFVSVATPYPGTELFSICKEKGYFAREFTLDDLFIRSYTIRTPDWSESELKKTLFYGKLYIRWRNFLAHPIIKLKRLLRHPIRSIRNIFVQV